MMHAAPVLRGCGSRVKGGVYAECGTSPHGHPIEDFIIDPPRTVPASIGLGHLGITPFRTPDGTTHIADWVGRQHYPNVADFIEETRRFGMSRRIPKNFDTSVITKGTWWLLVHPKAIPTRLELYRPPATDVPCYRCPKEITAHLSGGLCAGLWWEDLDPDATGTEYDANGPYERSVVRKMPSLAYFGQRRPFSIHQELRADYTVGFFLRLPVTGISVVADDDGSHKMVLDRIGKECELPVEEVLE